VIFLCDFTTWTADGIQTFLSHEGFLTLSDIPRFFDLPRYRKWDIPWNNAGVEMGADTIFPDIDPTATLPSKEKVTAVGDTMVEPLPSTETLPSKEKVIAVGATISEPLPSNENIAKYPAEATRDEANPDEEKKIIDPGGTDINFDPGGTAEKDLAKAEDGVKTTAAADKILVKPMMMQQPQMIKDRVKPMMMKPPQMIEDPVKPMLMKQPQMIADPVTPMMMKQPQMIEDPDEENKIIDLGGPNIDNMQPTLQPGGPNIDNM